MWNSRDRFLRTVGSRLRKLQAKMSDMPSESCANLGISVLELVANQKAFETMKRKEEIHPFTTFHPTFHRQVSSSSLEPSESMGIVLRFRSDFGVRALVLMGHWDPVESLAGIHRFFLRFHTSNFIWLVVGPPL